MFLTAQFIASPRGSPSARITAGSYPRLRRMFVLIPTLAERKLIQPRAGVGGVQIGTRCNKAHTDKVRVGFIGAGGGIRTRDLLITNQLLYRLSHTSISRMLA